MFKSFVTGLVVLLLGSICMVVGYQLAWPDTNLHFITCDIGQGDALLVEYGLNQILIDAGKDDAVLDCLTAHMPFWDRTLEMVVITHPDFDHYGGMRGVLERYNVKTVAQLPLQKKDAEFTALQKAIQAKIKQGTTMVHLFAGHTFTLDNTIQVQTVWPDTQSIKKLPTEAYLSETMLSDENEQKTSTHIDGNPLSITLLITYKKISILLTGDIEKESELALLKSSLMAKVTILKVGHHGSNTSSTKALLDKVEPEIAVISVGKNNHYRHPDGDVVHRLEKYVDQNLFRTDLQGEIHLITDGSIVWREE